MKSLQKYILLSLSFVLFLTKPSFSQNYDMVVNVTDKMINKLLAAIGPVSGEEEYSIMFIKGKYQWKVENPVIKLDEGKSWFEADVKVNTGNLSYSDRVNGLININYNKQTDKLELRFDHAMVDIKTKILGKEKLITTIDIANYYKVPFIFDGPGSYAEEFSFEMPDGSIKRLKTVVKNCDIAVSKGIIQMKANLDFVDPSKVKPTTTVSQTTTRTTGDDDVAGKTNTKKEKRKKRKENKGK